MVFYEPGKTDHGLPFDPFKACVIPRPIGWISTINAEGKSNLAPYSQFNNLTFDPPYVMFSANQTPDNIRKDSVINAEATGSFCWNLATWNLREAVNKSAQQVPYGVDEFDRAGLEKVWSKIVRVGEEQEEEATNGEDDGRKRKGAVPMVAESPVKFECKYHSTIRLPGNPPMGTVDIIIGRVVAVHIHDAALTDGRLDVRKTQPIARCGYYEYAVVRETFEMVIPGMDEAILAGLEGSSKLNKDVGKGMLKRGQSQDVVQHEALVDGKEGKEQGKHHFHLPHLHKDKKEGDEEWMG